jgi:hypothetical protein
MLIDSRQSERLLNNRLVFNATFNNISVIYGGD